MFGLLICCWSKDKEFFQKNSSSGIVLTGKKRLIKKCSVTHIVNTINLIIVRYDVLAYDVSFNKIVMRLETTSNWWRIDVLCGK
jgi:hypothetical protein